MKKPLIVITTQPWPDYAGQRLRDSYWQAVARAGGLPLLAPPLPPEEAPALLELADGLLLSGGGDLTPDFLNAPPELPARSPSRERDRWELALVREAWRQRRPLLGICRGMQVLAVALGGTLLQDIPPGAVCHDQSLDRHQPTHSVRVCHPALAELTGGQPQVNSHHHQAVASLPPALVAAAWAEDGVLEACLAQEPGRFALGLQWHPEALPATEPLFAAFTAACGHKEQA